MDLEAREAVERAERARRERALGEIAVLIDELGAIPGRPLATRPAATRLRRLLTTLRDDVPPELLARAKRVLGE